jgi:glycosyltransferase involved in cell wall biosynthesis/GT2 family glycosyltransferase
MTRSDKAENGSPERTPVLYLAPWVDLGGSDKGTIDWFRHIDRNRWAPSLISTQPSPNRWLDQLEPYAEEIWDLPDLMPGSLFPSFILGFIASRGVEVVHIMNSRLAFDLLPDIKGLPNPPSTVVQLHAEEPDRSGYVRYVARRYGNLVDTFSVTSRQLQEAVVGYGIPPSRADVIYTGVDAEQEFNPALVDPLELSGNGTPRILWPGRLVDQKDPLLTLDVLQRVREHGTDFVLDVVGDGELAPVVRERAEALGLADTIAWHPPSQHMAPWYRSADLLLMTSVFEGVPYVMYESLAMGVPVVAPALPGNLEFMDADSGALVEPRDDVEQYADAVVSLLGDGDRRRAMGDRSRTRMLQEFSLNRMGRDHDALYERLLASRAAELEALGVAPPTAEGGTDSAGTNEPPPPPRPSELFHRDPPPPRTVGVIVPCYRHGIYLPDCIASIEAQTLQPAAIVVVDDGSDDPETLAALAVLDDDPAVTVLRQDRRRGPSAARNRAIAELDTAYVLPLDADDLLLPDALERMVAQIEAAPADVGFVYPNAEHTGNRTDYIPSPAYNLWLLMGDNYCPAPALFDRRAFEAGAAYPEDMLLGHEDWDLLLQLAGLGIRGEHARGRTFRYRKYGFSRIAAVEHGKHSSRDSLAERHPSLYLNRDAIKARWSPAVSLVLADENGDAWHPDDVVGRPAQTCRDYELLAAGELGDDDIRAIDAGDGSPAGRLQACISAARGRWVCILTPRARAVLRDRSLVERLIHCFWDHDRTSGVVLAESPAVDGRAAFSQLDDLERLDAVPAAIAIERVPEQPTPPVELGVTGSLLTDLVVNVQAHGPLQWRRAPGTREVPSALTNGNGNGHHPPRSSEGSESAAPTVGLTLDREPARDRSVAWVHRAVSWQEPRLPGVDPDAPRRWDAAATWTPHDTAPLCRHRALNGDGWIVTNSRQPPPGYCLAYDLGVTHRFSFPGTSRLVADGASFALTDKQDELRDGRLALGYVEQVPLPMLNVLELRRDHETGCDVLVAGPEDPLFNRAEPLATLGWIDPFPINPRHTDLHLGPWGAVALRRYTDRNVWRHRYRVGAVGDESEGVALGSLLREPGEALVELRLRPDGRVESELARPSRASRDPRLVARWTFAPLRWPSVPPPSAQRAAGSRARHLTRGWSPVRRAAARPEVLGWLRRTPAAGYSALLSATHPVTGDQFLTRSKIEATDLGYRVDGVLGYVFNAGADSPDVLRTTTVLWGSRFGRGRRYAEA